MTNHTDWDDAVEAAHLALPYTVDSEDIEAAVAAVTKRIREAIANDIEAIRQQALDAGEYTAAHWLWKAIESARGGAA